MANLSRGGTILLLLFIWTGLFGFSPNDLSLSAEKVDINTASLEDLLKIIHIGEKRASELISLRPFSSLDELIGIKGLGESRVEDIKKQGLAWIGPEEPLTDRYQPTDELAKDKSQPCIKGIVINEILPSPQGSDAEEEWIELLNQNDFDADVSSWQIKDKIGVTKTYTFPEETFVRAKDYLVLYRPVSKITLNNNGDGLSLIRPDGEIVDSAEYGKAPRAESYILTESGWAWTSIPTAGAPNEIYSPPPPEKTGADETSFEKTGLAEISFPFREEERSESPFLYLTAFVLSIFSAGAILFLKKQLKMS